MGLRPTHGDESANVRCRRINGLWRAFNRAVKLTGGIHSMRKLALLMFIVTPLLAQFDPATFLSPPVQYRGHAMWSFPLSTLNGELHYFRH